MDDQAPSGESKPPPGTGAGENAGSADQRIQAIIQAAEQAAAGIIQDADAQARRYIDTSRQKADALADERVRVMSNLTETLVRQAELVRRQSDELLSALDSARDELAGQLGKELTQGSPPPAALAAPPAAAPQPQPSEPVTEAVPAQPSKPEQPGSQAPPGGSRVPHLQPVESKPPDLRPVDTPPAPEPEKPAAVPPPAEQSSSPPPAQSASPPPAQASTPAPAEAPPASAPASEPTPAAAPGGNPADGARLLAAQMAVAGSSREEIEARLRKEFNIEDASPILDGILGPN